MTDACWVAVLTGAAGKCSDNSYGSSGSQRLCSKLHSIYVGKYIHKSIHNIAITFKVIKQMKI